MLRKIFVLFALALFLSSTLYAATARGTVRRNASQAYAFTMPATGGVELTVTWNQNHDEVFVVMACGDGADPLEYSSVATQRRVARLDVGVIGGLTCAFAIATFGKTGTFTAAMSTSGDGPRLTRRSRDTPSLGLVELDAAEAAAMGLTGLEDKIRSLR